MIPIDRYSLYFFSFFAVESVSPVVAFRYGACVSALRLRKEEFRENHFATLFETCTPLLLSGGVFGAASAQRYYFDRR